MIVAMVVTGVRNINMELRWRKLVWVTVWSSIQINGILRSKSPRFALNGQMLEFGGRPE